MPLAYIGMGSNLASPAGSPEFTLAAAADRLASLGRLAARSSLYSTEPVGYAHQPRFLNAVVALETGLDPHSLLHALLGIEREFGRDRSAAIQNGPRTLDLDILLMDDLSIREPGLDVPHPRMAERQFVMVPLAEVASKLLDANQPLILSKLLQSTHERSPGKTDAVVPVHSTVWRAHADRSSDAPRGPGSR